MGKQPSYARLPVLCQPGGLRQPLQHDGGAQHAPPYQKVCGAPVPHRRQKPYRHQVPHRAQHPLPVSAQRNVHIFSKPPAQRYMPPAVEVPDAGCHIWIPEVLRQLKAQHPPQPYGHQRITVEVKVYPHGIGYGGHPCQRHGYALHPRHLHLVPEQSHPVSQKHLLRQPQREHLQSFLYILSSVFPAVQGAPLLVIARQGAGEQLGKHSHIGSQMQEGNLPLILPSIYIYQIREHLEGIEAHAQGQPFPPYSILKAHQHRHIICHRRYEPSLSPPILSSPLIAVLAIVFIALSPLFPHGPPPQMQSEKIIDQHGQHKDQKTFRLPIRIKNKTSRQQYHIFHFAGSQTIQNQKKRKKDEQKFCAAKYQELSHLSFSKYFHLLPDSDI